METTQHSAPIQGRVYYADPAYTRVLCPRCDDYKAVDKDGTITCLCGYTAPYLRWDQEIGELFDH